MAIRALLSGPIAKATILSLAIQVGAIAFGVVQAILTARLLGPEGYGVVAYVFSLSLLLATLALLGTEQLAVREVARLRALDDEASLAGFLRGIRRPVLWACVIGFAVTVLLMPYFRAGDENFKGAVWFTVLLFPLVAFTLQNQGILRGYGRVAMAQTPFQILRPALTVIVLVTVWAFGLRITPNAYLVTVAFGTGLAFSLTVFALSKLPQSEQGGAAKLDGFANMAAPFFLITVFGLLLREISTLMLAWWSTAEETGLFQPIARIAPLLVLGSQAAAMLYAPRVSELWATGEKERLARITRTFTWTTTGFSVAMAVVVLGLGEFILGLFGKAFTVNTAALWWIAAAQIVNAACGPVGFLLTMTNRASAAVWPQLAGVVVNIALSILLIPTQGAYGAAIAMSAGIVTWNIAMLVNVRRNLGMDPSLLGGLLGKRSTLAKDS